ncbi:hmp [Symbiodinium sp. KB8]|nr:hmp [Symbiodinium sp. KB8]
MGTCYSGSGEVCEADFSTQDSDVEAGNANAVVVKAHIKAGFAAPILVFAGGTMAFMGLATRAMRGTQHFQRSVWHQHRGLTQKTLDIVKDTLPLVAEAGTGFTSHFYQRMFAAHPELLNTFNLANQSQAASAVSVLENGTLPVELMEGVNQKHCALNAQYNVVGEHILGTITDKFNPGQEVLDAWAELYGALAGYCHKREEELYKEAESKPGGWRGMRKFTLAEKTARSSVITEFTFRPVDGKPISSYSPGQYTTIWTYPTGTDKRQPRHYSLISEPGSDHYTIAVKKESQGMVSSFLHDRTAVGDEFDLSPPFGNFSVAGAQALWTKDADAPVVLLSAGVGITPMLSMLGTLKNGAQASERPVLWLHAAENGRQHAFRDYIVGLARAHPDDLTRRVWYNNPNSDDIMGSDNKAPFHFKGMMDLTQVKDMQACSSGHPPMDMRTADMLPLEKENALYYFCGPVPWMKSIAQQLTQMGVQRSALNFEVFGPNEETTKRMEAAPIDIVCVYALLELTLGGHLYQLLCDKPQADLPHPKTYESPAEGAVRAARHKSVPLRATMMAQRVAAMFDELRDQVVAMLQEHEQQGSQATELQGQLAAQTQRVEGLEAELQGLRQSERTVQRKCVVGFLSCGEVFNVIQEWRGREGTLFLKLAGDKGWVFDKTRTGTFCVPVGSEWQDWRGPEGHKAWTDNNRDQHGSWNNAPSGNGRDRGGDKWKWACDHNDRGWGSSKESSPSWKGQEDKWGWDEKDRHAWSSNEWNS